MFILDDNVDFKIILSIKDIRSHGIASLCTGRIHPVVQSVKTRTIACRTPAELLRSEK